MSDRPCTCHPSEAPKLCQKMYALGECQAADEIERLRAVLREIAKPWTGEAADLRQAAEMVIAELERRRAVAEAALGGGDE